MKKRFSLGTVFLISFLLFPFLQSATAAGPPKEPILRLNTEMHTAHMTDMVIDNANRWLATSSGDKTVRLWELPTHRLVRILRPPIGVGEEGTLHALAFSPDGATIAASGYTGWDWEDSMCIYLFNREAGRMKGRITGLPTTVVCLAYSRDGRFLAAGLGRGGVRIYRVADNSLAAEDQDYGERIISIDFAADGRLLTACWDGYIRIYSREFRLLSKEKAPGGSRPHSARFTPDGQKIAVGFADAPTVNVLSGHDLSPLYSPDVTGLNKSSLSCVAWSVDGRYLYAGGRVYDERTLQTLIIKWADSGRGERSVLTGAKNTITQILPLKDGGILYGAGDPMFGTYDKEGEFIWRLYRGSSAADFRNNREGLLISHDGASVQFGYEMYGEIPARIFIHSRRLDLKPAKDKNLVPPITEAAGLKMAEWEENYFPKLNGRILQLDKYERCQSMAIAPAGEKILLGTYLYLRLFDRGGRERWKVSVRGIPWAVNISGDGRVAVAAFSDGTIRWYQMDDGKELLAFFPHNDRKRWLLWTPEGYFDASPDAAELVGYHLNQGKDKEAMFIALNNLYDVFYRPDIVQAKFRGEDISGLITLTAEQALQNPPPIVKFVSLPSRTDEPKVKICYQAISNGGGIGDVRVFHNAKLVRSDGYYREAGQKSIPEAIPLAALNSRAIYENMRGVKIVGHMDTSMVSPNKGDRYEACTEIESVSGVNEVSVAAFNKSNTVQSSLEMTTFKSDIKPEESALYILAIGIDQYKNKSLNLKYAVKDASDFLLRMIAQASTYYRKDRIRYTLLKDRDATRSGILDRIYQLSKVVKPGDGFILFDASHGVLIQNQYYIVTHNNDGTIDNESFISSNDIVESSKLIKALNQLYIFDTCHAGGVDNIISGLYDARMSVLAKKMGLHIYASASSVQEAAEGYRGNGLFTHVLLSGLNNNRAADKNGDRQVSVIELGEHSKNMTTAISQSHGQQQVPVIINFGRDYPLYKLK